MKSYYYNGAIIEWFNVYMAWKCKYKLIKVDTRVRNINNEFPHNYHCKLFENFKVWFQFLKYYVYITWSHHNQQFEKNNTFFTL